MQTRDRIMVPQDSPRALVLPHIPSRPLTEPTKTTPMNISQSTHTHTHISGARTTSLLFPNLAILPHQPNGPLISIPTSNRGYHLSHRSQHKKGRGPPKDFIKVRPGLLSCTTLH
ncbi:hypothetical protein B0T18DRAFT_254247 [Schizothecium vesticola]|uniref:Uncharacterized protein n=1 Tax=Schizothecium vesticola TaxID=314040 RepID=A0AA40EIM2_9PEZI|nr:hypothetical protein B0T18DRAFT_254247 [Schizothecium vesticola]